jgi:hypothetical protein
VSVTPGHTYAIAITVDTDSTLVGLGLLAGSTSARFDNVALTVSDGGGGGGDGDDSTRRSNRLTSSELLSLLRSDNGGGTAVLAGDHLFVKRPCPAKVGRSCRISLQGLLTKRKTATGKRSAKVAKGRSKLIALKVKPQARQKLAKSSRLLFRETVRAGDAKATIYKRLKLIRRH